MTQQDLSVADIYIGVLESWNKYSGGPARDDMIRLWRFRGLTFARTRL